MTTTPAGSFVATRWTVVLTLAAPKRRKPSLRWNIEAQAEVEDFCQYRMVFPAE